MKAIRPSRASIISVKPITLLRVRVCPGYFPGMTQCALLAEFSCPEYSRYGERSVQLEKFFLEFIPGFSSRDLPDLARPCPPLGVLAGVYEEILKKAGIPVLCNSRGASIDAEGLALHLPLLDHAVFDPHIEALRWSINLINVLLQGESPDAFAADLGRVVDGLGAVAPRGMNSRRFIEEAGRLDIPWRRMFANIYRFGLGSRSRLFDSSFTDSTPVIGANIARDKRMTAQLLHAAGLPGARHGQARDGEHAVKLAEQHGYPVVVKPADADGGAGVFPGLRTAAQVRKAFMQALEVSSQILVERHFEGNDYRLHVLYDEVYWVAHRVPGGVTGDGEHSISELVATVNADPRRGPRGTNALLKFIELDEEAQELLEEAGLNQNSVLPTGRFVRLRRAANVASGGYPLPVLEEAHPDNLDLAVRAARLLRLDVAGIDLLIPDIRRSWMESGALICEINAQPQLSPTLPGYLLKKLVKGNGRIPFIVVLGGAPGWVRRCQESLTASGCCVGALWPEGVYVDSRKIMDRPASTFQACEAILHDARVDFVILCLADDQLMKTGFPIDRFDSLVLVDPGSGLNQNGREKLPAFAGFLAELSAGEILVDRESQFWMPLLDTLPGNRIRAVEQGALSLIISQTLNGIQL